MTFDKTAYDEEQSRRARALLIAREVLIGKDGTFTSGGGPDVMDLVNVARWVYDGEDPWDDIHPDQVRYTPADTANEGRADERAVHE